MFPAKRTSERRRCALIEEAVQSASGRDGHAAAGMVKHSIDLVARDAGKPRQEIRYRRAPFEILKECAHGYSRVAEEPFTTDLSRDAFDGGTLAPVKHVEVYPGIGPSGTTYAQGGHECRQRVRLSVERHELHFEPASVRAR